VSGLLDGLLVAGTTGEFPALDELIAYYSQIRAAVPGAELYAYIFPERTALPVPPALFARVAQAAGLAGAKISGSAAGELAGYVEAAPGRRIFSGNDAHPAATMRAGGAGVISGRSSAYPEVYAALRAGAALGEGALGGAALGGPAQETLDRIVALGASIGRLKYALQLRGLGTGVARMTVDAPGPETAAAIAEQVAACQRYA
jgi:4-hydroxy-tetrahydrodipicolinate synthase